MKKLLLIVLCFCALNIYAQEQKEGIDIGLSYGAGKAYTAKNYEHNNHYFRANWLYTPKQKDHYLQYQVLLAPEINFAEHRQYGNVIDLKEYSLNIGGIARRSFSKQFSGLVLLSVGPDYLSKSTPRLSKGVAFSSNLALGATYKIEDISLNMTYGIRHLSNANIRPVNGGIDTHNLEFGVTYRLK